MQSARIDMFFSCSFKEEDKNINDLFIAICKALDIKCVNVDTAYSDVPPDVAREKIDEVQAVIAIATKRDQLQSGAYTIPEAVQEEISIAYGKEVPILLFVEEGATVGGMKKSFCTHLTFNRENLHTPEKIEQIIRSIHNLKLEIISPRDLMFEHVTPEIIADEVKHLVELKQIQNEFTWSYLTSKKIQFLDTFKKHIPIVFLAPIPSNIDISTSKPLRPEITLEDHSKNLALNIEVIKETADYSKSLIKIEPHPEKGDYIQYTAQAESTFFNPIYLEDIRENNPVEINGEVYHCFDGFIPLQRTKNALIEFRFPRKYGLNKHNIVFFVGSYSNEIDYILEGEMKRAKFSITEIAGTLTLRIEIEHPIPHQVYGFAWNPPQKPKLLTN